MRIRRLLYRSVLLRFWLLAVVPSQGVLAQQSSFTRADTLRGSLTPERSWWDVTFYDLHVTIDPKAKTLCGWNGISYRILDDARDMQIDLQPPLEVDSVVQDGKRLAHRRDGNAVLVTLTTPQSKGSVRTVTVYYHGKPQAAKHPPWDGGLVWAKDPDGKPWTATASQDIGASVWWPTKDTQADEPDSQRVALTVPDPMQAIANGQLRGVRPADKGWSTYEWFVDDPINNYAVAAYVGNYAKWKETYDGEGGKLALTFWPLARHLDAARAHFGQIKPTLACFEQWFGPYPWYRDGFQLVEAPFLGMEHQSAVAYGNEYRNGYLGNDLSGTGLGLDWDYIIVHETGHEWFGNNLTTADIADMWVHESFTSYAEALFVECQRGKDAGASYIKGTRRGITNDRPIVGPYGVNARGSEDMYYKGANVLHTIRQIIDNDSTWRAILRGLNTNFRHQIVTGAQVESYISAQAGIDLSRVFAQYLTTTKIPVLEYRIDGPKVTYRWTDVIPGFDMPVRVKTGDGQSTMLRPREEWQTTTLPLDNPDDFRVDDNFYVIARPTKSP